MSKALKRPSAPAAKRSLKADIGIGRWDVAPSSPLACPCCGAGTMMSQIEPPTGGGHCHYLIRCRRCRHEHRVGPTVEGRDGELDMEAIWQASRRST